MPNRQNKNLTTPTTTTYSEQYRFNYNGMEVDNEVSGNGNSYTTEFRQYDPRLGRWKSLDPLMATYPSWSPYNAFENNPIFYNDPSGLGVDDWFDNGEGEIKWIESEDNYEIVINDNGEHEAWVNIGEHLTFENSGLGIVELGSFVLFMDAKPWMSDMAFIGKGSNVWNEFPIPHAPSYSHPLMNSPGFAEDRITSNKANFVVNEGINSKNFSDAMMGAFLGGNGPENFYFGAKHSVSSAMSGSEIVHNAVIKFQEQNKGIQPEDEIKPLDWQHFSQSPMFALWGAFGSLNEGGGNPATVENFIGGAAIKITPLSVTSEGMVKARVTIFNVTSVGSGNVSNGQSFPRPMTENSGQPYTNISQVIEFDVLIQL